MEPEARLLTPATRTKVNLLRAITSFAIVLIAALEVGDYALRMSRRSPSDIWRGGTSIMVSDIAGSIRALVLAAICVVLWRSAGNRLHLIVAALTLSLYGAWSAAGIIGAELWAVPGIPFLAALVLAALIFTGTKFFQIFPEQLAASSVTVVLRFFLNSFALAALASVPIAAYFFHFLGGMPMAIWGVAVVVLQLAYLRVNLRRADAESRQRLFWLLEGMVLILFVNLLHPLAGVAIQLAQVRADVSIPLLVIDEVVQLLAVGCFAIGIFFHDALNAGLVVKRTFAVGLASSTSLIVFIALETLLGDLLTGVMPTQSRYASIVAGVVGAIIFKPIESAAGRLFLRLAGKATPARSVTAGSEFVSEQGL